VSTSASSLFSGASTGTGNSTGGSRALGQGIDVNSFVQLALAGDIAHITSLQSQQTTINSQSSPAVGDYVKPQSAAIGGECAE